MVEKKSKKVFEGCEFEGECSDVAVCCEVSGDEYWTNRYKDVIGKKLVRIDKGKFPGTEWNLEFEDGDVLRITTILDVAPYGITPVTSLGIGHIYREDGFSVECEKKG